MKASPIQPTQKNNSDYPPRNRLRTPIIILIACICGWFIMQLELLGVRILTPFFGSSIYVVTGSVIGTFLLCLALGYLLGGWLSRKSRSQAILGCSLILSGLWHCLLPLIIEPICDMIFNLGFNDMIGSLLAALVLFSLPTILLATASPAAVRWLTSRAQDAGLNTGLILAFSTAASFAGCLVTAFYFVRLSICRTITISGCLLIAFGLAVLLYYLLRSPKIPKNSQNP
jgi:hypothetical protein